jgi:hypothetical protein
METAQAPGNDGELDRGPHFTTEVEPERLRPWEEIDVGRYMPRRIRGSCRGRALG